MWRLTTSCPREQVTHLLACTRETMIYLYIYTHIYIDLLCYCTYHPNCVVYSWMVALQTVYAQHYWQKVIRWKFNPLNPHLSAHANTPLSSKTRNILLSHISRTNCPLRPLTSSDQDVCSSTHSLFFAGLYFHKIQCFCFDEQLLKAGETCVAPILVPSQFVASPSPCMRACLQCI